jgi:hypothetical protein
MLKLQVRIVSVIQGGENWRGIHFRSSLIKTDESNLTMFYIVSGRICSGDEDPTSTLSSNHQIIQDFPMSHVPV